MNINFTKINDNLFIINNSKKLKFKRILVPFKISEFKGNYYLNIEINHNDKINNDILDYYKKIELELYNLDIIEDINLKDINYYSNIKTKTYNNNNLDLLRLHIKKTKNSIVTKYNKNKQELTIFDIKPQQYYNCQIEINSIWIKNNKYGIVVNLLYIEDN